MFRSRMIALASFAALLVSSVALAQESPSAAATRVHAADYLDYLSDLRAAYDAGEPRSLSNQEVRMFDDAQASIRRLLAGKDDAGALSKKQQADLFSAQETIQSIVDNAEGERLVCRRESSTGSRLRTTTCVTASQRERQREAAQDMLRNRSFSQTVQPADPGQ